MSSDPFFLAIFVLITLMIVSLVRGHLGPTPADRLVAVNAISTKVIALIVLIVVVTGMEQALIIAYVYALIGFITTVAIAKYIETGGLD